MIYCSKISILLPFLPTPVLFEALQGSETQVDTQKTRLVFFWVNPPKNQQKTQQKTHPKFNPVSFLVLLITADFIMFKAFNSTSSEFAK